MVVLALSLVSIVFGVAVITDLGGMATRTARFLSRSSAKPPGRVRLAYYKLWARFGAAVFVASGVLAIKLERG